MKRHLTYCFVFLDGKFGAYMQVSIQNDGPVTVELTSPAAPMDPKQVPDDIHSSSSQFSLLRWMDLAHGKFRMLMFSDSWGTEEMMNQA